MAASRKSNRSSMGPNTRWKGFAKKNSSEPKRKLLLTQLHAVAKDLKDLSNLLAENSDDFAGGSGQFTCNSVDFVQASRLYRKTMAQS